MWATVRQWEELDQHLGELRPSTSKDFLNDDQVRWLHHTNPNTNAPLLQINQHTCQQCQLVEGYYSISVGFRNGRYWFQRYMHANPRVFFHRLSNRRYWYVEGNPEQGYRMHLVHDLPRPYCSFHRKRGEFLGSLGIVRERECDDLVDGERCVNPKRWKYFVQRAALAQRFTPFCVPSVQTDGVFHAFIQVKDSRFWFEPTWGPQGRPVQLKLTLTPRTYLQLRLECTGVEPKYNQFSSKR